MSGEHGRCVYRWQDLDGNLTNQCDGVSLENVLGVLVGDGAVFEVTVRLVSKGKKKHNPWLEPKPLTRRRK